jgi:hypothetical protein
MTSPASAPPNHHPPPLSSLCLFCLLFSKTGHISLHDDVARISPSQPELILDVISNDDLRGADPSTATLSVLAQPSVGTVSVLPPSGAHTHPRLLYKQGKDKLEPGSEVEVFYTVKVPGHPLPAPGTALLLGASEFVLEDGFVLFGGICVCVHVPALLFKDGCCCQITDIAPCCCFYPPSAAASAPTCVSVFCPC